MAKQYLEDAEADYQAALQYHPNDTEYIAARRTIYDRAYDVYIKSEDDLW